MEGGASCQRRVEWAANGWKGMLEPNYSAAFSSTGTFNLKCHECSSINNFGCETLRTCVYEIRRCMTIAIRKYPFDTWGFITPPEQLEGEWPLCLCSQPCCYPSVIFKLGACSQARGSTTDGTVCISLSARYLQDRAGSPWAHDVFRGGNVTGPWVSLFVCVHPEWLCCPFGLWLWVGSFQLARYKQWTCLNPSRWCLPTVGEHKARDQSVSASHSTASSIWEMCLSLLPYQPETQLPFQQSGRAAM